MTGQQNNYSQVTAMFAVARASFRAITRSPSAVVFTLLFPLIFILVFGFIGGSTLNVKIATTPQSDLTSPLYAELTGVHGIKFVSGFDSAGMEEALLKGKLDAIVDVGRAGGKHVVHLKTTRASADQGAMLGMIIENIVNRMNIEDMDGSEQKAMLIRTQITGRKYTMIDFILPGQLGFSILSAGVFGTAFVFFNLRQTLVIKRFFATPIRKPFIILGEALSRLVFSLLGSLFIIVIGYYAFGFTLLNGVITVLTMLLLSAIGLIVFMGFGFIISGVAKNESMIPPLANTITLPQFLLSGTFFPIDAFPEWLQPLCKILPLTYLNDALRLVAFEGAGLPSLWFQLLVILGWGILVYGLAVRFFRWE